MTTPQPRDKDATNYGVYTCERCGKECHPQLDWRRIGGRAIIELADYISDCHSTSVRYEVRHGVD